MNLKVIKKTEIQTCWVCDGQGCKVCKNTGKWKENHYIFITINSKGQRFAIDADTIK